MTAAPEGGRLVPEDEELSEAIEFDEVVEPDGAAETDDAAEPAEGEEHSDTVAEAEAGLGFDTTFSARQLRRARTLLSRLYSLRRAVQFYPEAHPAVREGVEDLYGVIREYHSEGVDVPITFYVDEILLGEQLLSDESILFEDLIAQMMEVGAGSIVFRRDLEPEELQRAVLVLAMEPEEVAESGGLGVLAAEAEIPHVQLGAVRTREQLATYSEDEPEEARAAARRSYMSAVDLLRELELVIQARQSSFPRHAKSVVRSLVDNVVNNEYAMLELSGLKSYDEYTFYHSVNVAILSLALGARLSTDRRFLTVLGLGALMHDVGKMAVDRSILNKSGSLEPEEWTLMRRHPRRGAEIAASIPGMDKSAMIVIFEHHMRCDGRGYPRYVIPDAQQHVASRITAIADAFDAMTSRRSYSAARLQDDAMSVLVRNVDSSFDPALTRMFVELLGVYPPRSVVRLSGGEVGVVVRPGRTPPQDPIVRVIAAPDGTLIDPVDIDLADPDEAEGRSIEACLDGSQMNVRVDEYM
jgi:HD-GYP domain-containing protein (c-di-GMP phosphodiesterase class II)